MNKGNGNWNKLQKGMMTDWLLACTEAETHLINNLIIGAIFMINIRTTQPQFIYMLVVISG